MRVFIPEIGLTYVFEQDCDVYVSWFSQNLKLLRLLDYTGHIEEKTKAWCYDTNGKYEYVDRVRKKAIPNPLYMDNDGEYVDVLVHIPKGTEICLTRFSDMNNDGSLFFKILKSQDAKLEDRILRLTTSQAIDLDLTIK